MWRDSALPWQESKLAESALRPEEASGAQLRAVRGAITVAHDEPSHIHDAARTLIAEMAAANGLDPADVVSVIFTVTPDLHSAFPATGVRALPGWSAVPLLCASEIDVPGGLPRCIRALVHTYTTRPRDAVQHAYLGDARVLRPDLQCARGSNPVEASMTGGPPAR